jgi:2-amino-4-hydroxy-6-hydroxymethyldihydropteridine diphosphokinase
VIDAGRVIVPHPRFRNRLFVLEPLAEIAPGLRDPVTGKTVGELLDWVIW